MALASTGSIPVFPTFMKFKSSVTVSRQVNLLISQRKKAIKVTFSCQSLTFLKLFTNLGLINNYIIQAGNTAGGKLTRYIWFTLFFYKARPFFRSLQLVSKPSKSYFIAFKSLKIISKLVGLSVLILETSRGVISHLEALRYRTGGILLFILT